MTPGRRGHTGRTGASVQPTLPPVVAEEQRHLVQIRTTLVENPEGPGRSEDDLVQELMRLQADYREARLADDKGLINQQIMQLMALLDQQRKSRPGSSIS